jgi:hypothetical protein
MTSPPAVKLGRRVALPGLIGQIEAELHPKRRSDLAFSVSTWNINSVRLRLPLVQHFLETAQPDVLCLQETKCPNDAFPFAAFRKLGYEHMAIHGQKGYHGVAILSRLPLSDDQPAFLLRHCRCAACVGGGGSAGRPPDPGA